MALKLKFTAAILVVFFVETSLASQLEKVLILSRHGLRTPLTSTLKRMTSKTWPPWNYDVGFLTEKGAELEIFMGKYFSEWLASEGLIKSCPDSDKVHIFANTRQRTKASAQAFVKGAFPNCDIPIKAKNSTEMDPVFNPIVRNNTKAYVDAAKAEMSTKIKELNIKTVLEELNQITDIEHSETCKEDAFCDLAKDENGLIFEINKEPNVTGPLFIGTSIVDSFLMSYYEGNKMEDIAWGGIKTDTQWDNLAKLLKENLDVRFNLTVAKDICYPLLKYIKNKLLNDEEIFTLLMGHDSNIYSVISALGFNSYALPGQLEFTPVGGKLVIQKWAREGQHFAKIEYVYQTVEQLRNKIEISLVNPPNRVVMVLKNCPVDSEGFCLWDCFINLLNKVTE